MRPHSANCRAQPFDNLGGIDVIHSSRNPARPSGRTPSGRLAGSDDRTLTLRRVSPAMRPAQTGSGLA
jgi:hypothetical protein